MKKVLIGCSVALVFLASTWVVCAGSANFSGTWVLDKSKSRDLPPQIENIESYTMVVTQDDQQLTVENKIVGGRRPDGGEPGTGGQGGGRRPDGVGGQGGGRRGGRGGFGMGMPTATYKLDGTETKLESAGGRGGAVTLKAQWKDGGKALELMTTRSISFQGNETTRTTKEHWELADSGKTLKIKRTVDGRQGPQDSTLVFSHQ
jgi:hypothetical protein